jgi:hypothetical protein
MISDIRWLWLWAVSSGTHSSTYSVEVPNKTVIAQISLARVSGIGSAKAFIRQYCSQRSSDQIVCAFEPNPDDAPSVIKIDNATTITFEVQVKNMFGYATAMVFEY